MRDFVDDGKGYGDYDEKSGFSLRNMFKRSNGAEDSFGMVSAKDELIKSKKKKKKKGGSKPKKGLGSMDGSQDQEVHAWDDREVLLHEMFGLGYQEIFFKCDSKHGRTLDDDEFARFPTVLGLAIDENQVDLIRKEMDVHMSGVVEWPEWLAWWRGNSPGWQMLLDKQQSTKGQCAEAEHMRRERTMADAKLMAEDTTEYWQIDDGTTKMSKFKDRRVEIAGRGRGTVLDAKKKGLLVSFDGHEQGWTGEHTLCQTPHVPVQMTVSDRGLHAFVGVVCGFEVDDVPLAPAIEETSEPFEELVRANPCTVCALGGLIKSP